MAHLMTEKSNFTTRFGEGVPLLPEQLTEEDVRRIVREEISRMLQNARTIGTIGTDFGIDIAGQDE